VAEKTDVTSWDAKSWPAQIWPNEGKRIHYDEASVRAGAHTLFVQSQRRLVWTSLGSLLFCFSVIGAISWWFGFYYLMWFPIGLLTLQLLLLPYAHWTLTRRLLRKLIGTNARFRFDTDTFSMHSGPESHVLPWRRFQFTRRDARNVLLFLTQRSALIIPTTTSSSNALEFAIERISSAHKAV
jgi:hypothetical protein